MGGWTSDSGSGGLAFTPAGAGAGEGAGAGSGCPGCWGLASRWDGGCTTTPLAKPDPAATPTGWGRATPIGVMDLLPTDWFTA